MSIIIRLQNLPWEANSLDIRRFFQGLQIPDGGVHIVGGDKGDAFIAFGGDEDARQAMERDGGLIKENRIKLLLSSRSEMQRVIEQARNQTLGIKAIDNPASVTSTNSGLLPTPQQIGVQNNNIALKVDSIRPHRSPERRQERSRSIERERERFHQRPRSRSRSPLRNDITANRNINANAIVGDRTLASLQPELINPLLSNVGALPAAFASLNGNSNGVRSSRLGFGDTVATASVVALQSDATVRNQQWPIKPDSFDNQRLAPALLDPMRVLPNSADRDRLPSTGLNVLPNQFAAINERAHTVEMRNLPFNISLRDIYDFFRGIYIPEENVKILINDNGYPTGGALVRFTNQRELENGLSLNGRFMGDRRIEIHALAESLPLSERSDLFLRQQAAIQTNLANSTISSTTLPARDYVLYMKGLPFNSCTERDVANFFQGVRLADIVIETDGKGKPTGNAFVELENTKEYDAAMRFNMQHMGRRYIELLPTNKDDMQDARRIARGLGRSNKEESSKLTLCVNITGLPPTISNKDLTDYFVAAGAQPYAIHIMLKPNGMNAGEAFVEFISSEHQFSALRRDGDSINGHRIVIKSVPYEVMRNIIGKPPQNNATENRAPTSRANRDDHRPRRGERDSRRRGGGGGDPFVDLRSVVIASNIPYRATTDDICVFFSDYGITEDHVLRRFNDKGQPTADAKIAFHSPEDATRAVRAMHKKFLIGRPIFLRQSA